MTADKIKSILSNSYVMFIMDFADPTQIKLEYQYPIEELFNSQKTADRAKKQLGKDGFNKAVALYFSKLQNSAGVDSAALEENLRRSKKVFVRHLGKDKVQLLELIVMLSKSLEERGRGLLGVAI
jgi:hypothetical protein